MDINAGIVTLYFSETVASTFSPAGITIQSTQFYDDSGENPTVSVTLQTTDLVSDMDGLQVTFRAQLDSVDLNELKFYGLGLDILAGVYLVVPYALTASTRQVDQQYFILLWSVNPFSSHHNILGHSNTVFENYGN